MSLKKLLILDRCHHLTAQKLKLQKELECIVTKVDDLNALRDANGIFIRTGVKVSESLLNQMPQLEVIVTATSGFDHIDIEAALRRNIKVFFAPEGNILAAAELTFALVLASFRKLRLADQMVRSGEWNREPLQGRELAGKTYGIIGLGRIGSKVATLAKAFSMEVVAFDPYLTDEQFEKTGVERVGLTELLKTSDVISLHVPLTDETRKILNSKTFSEMTPGVVIVNTSRGGVVDENDLLKALDDRIVSAAALDVFESEPLVRSSQLLKQKDMIVTPHCGGNTVEAFERSCRVAGDKLISFFQGQKNITGNPLDETWYAARRQK